MSWDRELEFGNPDSRLRNASRHQREALTPVGRLWMERVYCANCGCDGGLVTPEWFEHVFYLCQECADKHGKIAGTVEAPEHLVRGDAPTK
jgi:hypothetical protein